MDGVKIRMLSVSYYFFLFVFYFLSLVWNGWHFYQLKWHAILYTNFMTGWNWHIQKRFVTPCKLNCSFWFILLRLPFGLEKYLYKLNSLHSIMVILLVNIMNLKESDMGARWQLNDKNSFINFVFSIDIAIRTGACNAHCHNDLRLGCNPKEIKIKWKNIKFRRSCPSVSIILIPQTWRIPADSQRFPQNPPPRPNEEVRLVWKTII